MKETPGPGEPNPVIDFPARLEERENKACGEIFYADVANIIKSPPLILTDPFNAPKTKLS